jgi:hypothetical protein
MRAQHSHITDTVSGQRLDSLKECVAIEVKSEAKATRKALDR